MVDGLRALDDPGVASELGPEVVTQLRAYGKFMQGLSLATLALFYDRGFIVDETTDPAEPQEPADYHALMDAALASFDDAISMASSANFDLPFRWMQADLSSEDLVQLAHSYRARFRAQVARTPEERAAVDWGSVIADVDSGSSSTFNIYMDWNTGWQNTFLQYATWPDWNQLAYFMYGMADQSGEVSEWLSLPLVEKAPRFADGRPVLIVTPDLRFPQGTTVEEQRSSPGLYFRITSSSEVGNTWQKPERGAWRWSWYKAGYTRGLDYAWQGAWEQPEITLAEMRLLKAEGLYRNGDRAGAADIINESRVRSGLNATDASGTNTSCVPKLPDGNCGDLWEMLKWEKRMETVWTGVAGANWFFDGRGWGDLWKETPLQFPIPCRELHILQLLPCNTFGGPAGDSGLPGSTYAFPFEG
ncbi:MAG: RagB/SusD family nutrient uptake outer membrane protein [Gemmatimonadota bacterium]